MWAARCPTDDAKVLFETWRDVFERSQKEDDFNANNSGEVIRAQQAALRMITRYGDFRVGADMFREVATSASVSGVTFHTLGLTSLRRSRNVLASRSDVEISSVGQGISTGGITDTRASLAMDDGNADPRSAHRRATFRGTVENRPIPGPAGFRPAQPLRARLYRHPRIPVVNPIGSRSSSAIGSSPVGTWCAIAKASWWKNP